MQFWYNLIIRKPNDSTAQHLKAQTPTPTDSTYSLKYSVPPLPLLQTHVSPLIESNAFCMNIKIYLA